MTKINEAVPATEPKAEVRPLGLTPYDHGRVANEITDRKGLVFNGNAEPLRSPRFRAAEQLHGWNAHKQHSNEPLIITREAFDAAIDAAMNPDERGAYAPHRNALAPHLKGNS